MNAVVVLIRDTLLVTIPPLVCLALLSQIILCSIFRSVEYVQRCIVAFPPLSLAVRVCGVWVALRSFSRVV